MTLASTSSTIVSQTSLSTTKFKTIFPAIFGTIVEYYDYALYGFSAGILANHFFPSTDPTIALLQAYGIFIAGSCSKPLGSLLFGYLGDKYGRSLALKISMLGIAIPTAVVGLMPGYSSLGWWAALVLLICRMLQGMFVSGESDAVRIFIYETLSKKRPCFSNSISGMACMGGVYLASYALAFTQTSSLFELSWSWRVPFLIGGVLGVLVIVLRQFLKETPDFENYLKQVREQKKQTNQQQKRNTSTNSYFSVILRNKRSILITLLLYGVVGGGYHFYFVFFGTYLSQTLHLFDASQVASITAQSILIYTLCSPIAGYLADRFKPLVALKVSAIGLLGITLLSMIFLKQGYFPVTLWLLTAVALSFFHTPGFVMLFQQFSVGERFRCVSIGHSIGSMLLSGTAPFCSLWIWKVTGQAIAPLIYFMLLTLLGYFALMLCGAAPHNSRDAKPSLCST